MLHVMESCQERPLIWRNTLLCEEPENTWASQSWLSGPILHSAGAEQDLASTISTSWSLHSTQHFI